MTAAVRALITIGVAALWVAIFAPPMFATPPSADTGTHLIPNGALVHPNAIRVDANSPAYKAGLRTGDVLGCLSPRDAVVLLRDDSSGFLPAKPETPVSTCVRRGGAIETISFMARDGPPVPNSYGSDALTALRIAVALVFLLTGIALVLGRPGLSTWIFFIYCLGSTPSWAVGEINTRLPSWQHAITAGPLTICTGVAVAFLLLFAVIVPDHTVPNGWRRSAFLAAALVAALDVAFTAFTIYFTGATISPAIANSIDESLTGLTVLLVVVRLFNMERSERARFGWAAFAIIFGVVANDLRNVLSTSQSQTIESISVFAADLTILMPLTLTYAILKRHVIDVRFVISKTVVYAALTTVIVGVIGAVDWLTSAYLSQARIAMAIDAAVTIGLAFVLHRAYGWVERAVDFLLFQRKHRAETYLNRLAKTLLRSEREETIDRAVVHAPFEKLDLAMAALFRAQNGSFVVSCAAGWDFITAPAIDAEHELVRFLMTERQRLEIKELRAHVSEHFQSGGSAPALAIPIFQGDELTAFAVYGVHRDGTKLDPDEVETLEHLCELAAQGYVRIELLHYRALSQHPLPA